jgi:tetratricopeptide (TPR) repeat protein
MTRALSLPRLTLFLAVVCAIPVLAQDEHMHAHHHEDLEQLGKVSFPVSCAPDTQKSFERGIALLHSFGYEEAGQQFTEIAQKDPSCAMAHWGVAMSLFHQIWERPQESRLQRGNTEMETAEKLGAKTDRERAYMSALAVFYRDPSSKDYEKRVTAYSDAMGQLYQKYPKDLEAGAFYALSLLAAEPPGDSTHAASKKAVAVLLPLFQREPEHPGLAHYIIHACDNPQMAPMALEAARRYAAIAPSSAHAVHMPSHIFARLGLWQEDIQSNLKSVALCEKSPEMYMHGHELHAMHFLLYAYLQTGQDEAARRIVDDAEKIIASAPKDDNDSGMLQYFGVASADFPALYALETHHWSDAAALQPPAIAEPQDQMITWWARTIGSAHRGDVETARASAKKFAEAEEALGKSKYAYMLNGPHTSRGEVQAWLAFSEKKNDEAVRLMRQVADTQDQVGKGEVAIPAREMLADMLLALNQPDQALAEYEKSMKIDPNRFNGLAGAARAAELANQPARATAYYAQLLKNCPDPAHSDRPELHSAQQIISQATH